MAARVLAVEQRARYPLASARGDIVVAGGGLRGGSTDIMVCTNGICTSRIEFFASDGI